MADIVLRGGTVLDSAGARDEDVLVRRGVVADVGPNLDAPARARVLDARGCVVAPGLVDLHTHLREPGGEAAETVQSGARAAALGGYTAVVAMPNTDPPIDCAAVVRQVLQLGAVAPVDVAVAGAITVGRHGQSLAPMAEMAALGVHLFTDDGNGVQDARLMRRALEYASALGVTLAQHCEDRVLAEGGHMHEGEWSSRLGIGGAPPEAEELMVHRDLLLARRAGAPLHLLHLSTRGSLELVQQAKARRQRVTAEVAPHHFSLTDAAVAGYDPVFKVNPPLRPRGDVEAVREALASGLVDAIATDHAPHPQEAKEAPFEEAPPGMVGLETALGVALTVLAGDGLRDDGHGGEGLSDDGHEDGSNDRARMGLPEVLALMSWRPAAIAGLAEQGGPVAPGSPANLCVIDPHEEWVVEPRRLASRSRNTPFAGRRLRGRVRHTVLHGEAVVEDGEARR